MNVVQKAGTVSAVIMIEARVRPTWATKGVVHLESACLGSSTT